MLDCMCIKISADNPRPDYTKTENQQSIQIWNNLFHFEFVVLLSPFWKIPGQ
jgi:hypothetical protein